MQSHTIEILKLWKHIGIVNHSIAQYFDWKILKKLKTYVLICVLNFIFSPNDSP